MKKYLELTKEALESKNKDLIQVVMTGMEDMLKDPNFAGAIPYTAKELSALFSILIAILSELYKKMGVEWEITEEE